VVHLPVPLAKQVDEISEVVACKPIWQNMLAYKPCIHNNGELLLVFRMEYTLKIRLCALVLVVNIDDAVSIEMCLICKEHCGNKEILRMSVLSTCYKCILSVAHKLNVS
jgi:hypothetical protein